MFMEFLYPKTAEDKNIMLLLIVQLDGVTDAVTYVWKDNERLSASEPEIYDFKLRKQHRLPTMIVPLTKESSFLVLTTTSMAVYSFDGETRLKVPLSLVPNPDISAASMWTRWARPARNWLYSQSHDGIYLCREDGWIYLLEFGNEGNLKPKPPWVSTVMSIWRLMSSTWAPKVVTSSWHPVALGMADYLYKRLELAQGVCKGSSTGPPSGMPPWSAQ